MRSNTVSFLCRLSVLVVSFSMIVSDSIADNNDYFTITETFRTSEAGRLSFGGSLLFPAIKAYLTSGVDDPAGDGWLRLTRDLPYQAGSAVVNESFPSKVGVWIDLEYKTWRELEFANSRGADGFSIFLYDADSTFEIGGFGGSLGYAPHVKEGTRGLSGGYVGIGFDEYGNFSNPTEGRTGGDGMLPNSVGVRGPFPNYAWLGGNTAMTDFMIQYGYSTKRPTDDVYFRRIQIQINPTSTGTYSIMVRVQDSPNGAFKTLLKETELPSLPPEKLRLGLAASTGADVNYHEIRNLRITTPGGVSLTKEVDKAEANVGDELTYKLVLYNNTDNSVSNLRFHDPLEQLPPEFQVEEVTFSNDDNPFNDALGWSNTNLSNISVSLGANSHATFKIRGIVKDLPEGGVIKNTAIFNEGTSGILNANKTNDTATVSTKIIPKALFIPNVFTPNGDGVNDVFEVVGIQYYTNPRLRITNRWGDEVYYNPNYNNDWDGIDLMGGTYYYHLTLTAAGKDYVYKGWVLIKK